MVLANEEVISALLGAMVELDGYTAVFPQADEQPLTAITRHRPDLLLLDCEHEFAWDIQGLCAARGAGARVLLFSAMRSQRELEQVAAQHGIPAFTLPVTFREFTTQVDRLLEAGYDAPRAIGA
jgi:hypothetical protein